MDTYKLYMDLPDKTTMEWHCVGKPQLRIVTAQINLVALQLRGILRVVDHTGKEMPR